MVSNTPVFVSACLIFFCAILFYWNHLVKEPGLLLGISPAHMFGQDFLALRDKEFLTLRW